MLVLTRKPEEKIYVGNDIVITIVQVKGDRVRLGIEAPKNVRVLREEVANAIQKEQAQPSADAAAAINADGPRELPRTSVINAVADAAPKSSPLASRIAHRRMLGDSLQNLSIEPVKDSGSTARRAPGARFTPKNRFSQHLGPASLMDILDRFKDQK